MESSERLFYWCGKSKDVQVAPFFYFGPQTFCHNMNPTVRRFLIDADSAEDGFFNQGELTFFKKWQKVPYVKDNAEHYEAKTFLMNTVWAKTIMLGKAITNRLDGFLTDGKRIWSERGWNEVGGLNQQSAVFKPYTWTKIFPAIYQDRGIFFTVGLDANPDTEAFIYKIDFRKERDVTLSAEQLQKGEAFVKGTASWNEIPFEQLVGLSLDQLTDVCLDFIHEHLEHYHDLVHYVWKDAPITPTTTNALRYRPKPAGHPMAKEYNPSFQGVDVDYIQDAIEKKATGDAGEDLVKDMEIRKLRIAGLQEKADQVRIAKDGEGYDVFSFDLNGNELYIEVKTTTGTALTPFYLSRHEYAFLQRNAKNYVIYRVYHYDAVTNTGEYFEINGDIDSQLHLSPLQYEVTLK